MSPSADTLGLALKLLESDQRERAFFAHPYLLNIHKRFEQEWLSSVRKKLDDGTYVATATRAVEVPKPDWHVRPGLLLSLDDELIYNYLIQECLPQLRNELNWSDTNGLRHSYLLGREGGDWFRNSFQGWSRFREESNALIDSGFGFVVFADISGYYENIDLGRLARDLREHGVAPEVLKLLSPSLNKWADPRQRGIPQGYSPSHILGETYLSVVDRHLHSEGFTHRRYVDDFRLFARTEVDARRAFIRLQALLRSRGLNLQSSKSAILQAADASRQLNNAAHAIERILKAPKQTQVSIEDGYDTVQELPPVEITDPIDLNKLPPEVLSRAWRDFELGSQGIGYDKTIYHFLLKRLGERGMSDAVEYSVRVMLYRPEETQAALQYLTQVCPADDSVFQRIAVNIRAHDIVFDYQKYQILRWYFEHSIRSEALLDFARGTIRTHSREALIRPYATAYLGLWATRIDYDSLQEEYRQCSNDAERATVICAFARAPTDLKGSFYGRCKDESPLISWAIEYAKRMK